MGKRCEPGCQCGRHRHVLTTKYQKICEECQAEFTAQRSDARFCSGDCQKNSYQRENKDRILTVKAIWAANNREKVKEARDRWEEQHGEEARQRKRDRYKAASAFFSKMCRMQSIWITTIAAALSGNPARSADVAWLATTATYSSDEQAMTLIASTG